MALNHSDQQPVDPELKRRLQQLRKTPPRNPDAVARGRAKFIAEVDELVQEQGFSPTPPLSRGTTFRQRWKEKWNMATPRTRMVFTFVMAFAILAVFLFGGAGMTAYASQSALPGDALYSVKTGVEQTQVSLAGDAAEKARLNLAFAERRLDEIARLIENGRYADIAQAVQEYENSVQSAIAALETVAAGDPAGAQELASQVALLLNRYAETLSGMASALPDTARTEVERAIQVSHTAGSMSDELEFVGVVEAINAESWVVGGRTLALTATTEIKGAIAVGSRVKVHAWEDAGGNLVLREVELADDDDMDDDLNDNGNFNGNDNPDDGNLNGDDEGEFSGIVEQIGAGFWVISGRTLAIVSGSEIESGIEVGDLVKVEFVYDANGNLVLREIEFAGDDDANSNDDNMNEDGDDIDDDANLNGNSNFNGDDDEDDNRNSNVNQNSNDDDDGDDDDHNSNQNSNDNDDYDDDDSNDNDDHDDDEDDDGNDHDDDD